MGKLYKINRLLFLTIIFLVSSTQVKSSDSNEQLSGEDSDQKKYSEYIIQENDTLMLIAFKIYGDFRRWKELAKLNPHLDVKKLQPNRQITYEVPTELFEWEALGEPYLIKLNDTLMKISYDVYDTHQRWKEIWYNNRPLIRNPNKIYAGMTIYYIPDEDIKSLD